MPPACPSRARCSACTAAHALKSIAACGSDGHCPAVGHDSAPPPTRVLHAYAALRRSRTCRPHTSRESAGCAAAPLGCTALTQIQRRSVQQLPPPLSPCARTRVRRAGGSRGARRPRRRRERPRQLPQPGCPGGARARRAAAAAPCEPRGHHPSAHLAVRVATHTCCVLYAELGCEPCGSVLC